MCDSHVFWALRLKSIKLSNCHFTNFETPKKQSAKDQSSKATYDNNDGKSSNKLAWCGLLNSNE